jgi:two-component system, response regulator FlrC
MRLLIVGKIDSEVTHATQIAMRRGAKVANCRNAEEAFKALLAGNGAELLMIDVNEDIAGLVKNIRQERINISIVAYGINADSKKAVEAIKAGAEEYIPLPPDEELIAAILESITRDTSIINSKSAEMQRIIELAERVAPSDANVLITGESGTGKEVIAKYIHKKSNRKNEHFVSVNCAAIPDNLLESELFGHEKGAFTGALNRRIGKFEESNNGTLLLDEISEMDLRLQAKLLRAIQEKEIDRVGGNHPVKINLRVIATSNRDLKEEVKKGNFREDLLFRLNVIHLALPPLRNRPEDIRNFAEHFVEKFAKSNQIALPKISTEAYSELENYHWQGNVRELENTIHRAVLLSNDGIIDEASLLLDSKPRGQAAQNSGMANSNMVGQKLEDVEKKLILDTLNFAGGNRTHAAEILGISIRTLRNKIKEYEQNVA